MTKIQSSIGLFKYFTIGKYPYQLSKTITEVYGQIYVSIHYGCRLAGCVSGAVRRWPYSAGLTSQGKWFQLARRAERCPWSYLEHLESTLGGSCQFHEGGTGGSLVPRDYLGPVDWPLTCLEARVEL